MGRQINFYISENDQIALDEIIRAKMPELLIIRYRATTPELQFVLTTLDTTLEGKTMFLAPSICLGKVSTRFTEMWGPWRGYVVDEYISPVIEYSRSHTFKNENGAGKLNIGRIYYQQKFFDQNDNLIEKDPEFVKSAKKLFGLFKKQLIYIKDRDFYFGKGALELEKQGWILPINNI